MKGPLKNAVLASCAALLLALSAGAAAAAGPKAVAVEAIKDVGTLPKGEKIVHDFVIRNEGDAVLQITEVRAACGCTVANYDKTIAPGQTGKVNVVIDTATFSGAVAKGVTVLTNDPQTPEIELTVKAKLEPMISVKPGYARYITVQKEPKQGVIVQTLWAPDGSDFDIVKVDSPYPFLTTTHREAKPEERQAVEGVPADKGKQWRVEMTLSNETAPVGPLSDFVTVHTNHAKQKLVQIPISGFVRPVVTVTPPVADFGQIELKEPLRKAINIRNFATEPIKVTGIEEDMQGVDVALEPLNEGREYQVRVVLKPELGKGPFNGKLTIRTDSPKIPVIAVDLKGTVL
ncbi:MAG TPA: DUF1573 domain-containing protein [Thermoanaerobaculia bacterium]|nr:DUF1573 domain-containing protein [Thermoanaerobaculia bacterium]